jgi:hypothetical protein
VWLAIVFARWKISHFILCGQFAGHDAILRKRQLDKMKNYFHTTTFNKITAK